MRELLKMINSVLPLPTSFDQNEYFILLNWLGFLWVIFLAKRFPLAVKILVLLFGICTAVILDHALAGPPLDLYDIGDSPKYELFDELGYLMYTPYTYLSIYLFNKLNPKGFMLTIYVIGMSLFGIGFEWLSIHFHVFSYKQWRLLYSFPVYLVVSILHLLFFKLCMRYFDQRQQKPS